MLAAIASPSVQSLIIAQAVPAYSPRANDPALVPEVQGVEQARHVLAGPAALAPAAMTALLSAQEHMTSDSSIISRTRAVHEIDHVIARATGAPAITVTSAGGDFSLARLMTARQQLRETFA